MPLDKLFGVDLDEVCAYSVPRYLKIKDGVVGISYCVLTVGIAFALLFQLFYLDKGYYKSGQVAGVSRVQPQAPTAEWRYDALNMSLPFCSDVSTNTLPAKNSQEYTLFPPTTTSPLGQYRLLGHVLSDRYNCQYLDEKFEVTDPLDASSVFLPTRIVSYVETARDCSTSSSATHVTADGRNVLNTTASECTYTAGPKQRWFIPDVEAYSLYIQHSIAVPLLGATWSKDAMVSGSLIDVNGNPVDPCNFYHRRNPAAACPLNVDSPVANATHYISVGVRNVPDIIAVGTLLEAAGVSSLDETGLPATDTHRYGGITLIVQMLYSNYWSSALDGWRQVKYVISVQAVPGKVKGVFGVSSNGAVPTTTRHVFERSGLRIIFSFSGTLGRPDLAAGFVSLAAVGQSLTLAVIVVGLLVNYGLRLSPIYRRYITSVTHDFSAVKTRADFKAVFKLFEDEFMLPTPAKVLDVLNSLSRKSAGASAALVVRETSAAHALPVAESRAPVSHPHDPHKPQLAVAAAAHAAAHPPHEHETPSLPTPVVAAAQHQEIYAFGDDDDSEAEEPAATAAAGKEGGWFPWLGI